jgi:cell division septal protein FtsQ
MRIFNFKEEKKVKILKFSKRFFAVAFLVSSIGGAVRILYRPPAFLRVKEVAVMSPLKNLNEFDVVRLSGVRKGDPLLTLSLSKVRADLLRYPWVKDVHLSKKIPARVLIWVEEQKPMALVSFPSKPPLEGAEKLYLVNEEGIIFKEAEPRDPKNLPTITGLQGDEGRDRLPQVIRLLKAVGESPSLNALGISEFHWDEKKGFSIFTEEPCVRLDLGEFGADVADWEEKLRLFGENWEAIRKTVASPKVVDLSVDRKMIVKREL